MPGHWGQLVEHDGPGSLVKSTEVKLICIYSIEYEAIVRVCFVLNIFPAMKRKEIFNTYYDDGFTMVKIYNSKREYD